MSATPRTDAIERGYDDEEYRAAASCIVLARDLERELVDKQQALNAALAGGSEEAARAARLWAALANLADSMDINAKRAGRNLQTDLKAARDALAGGAS